MMMTDRKEGIEKNITNIVNEQQETPQGLTFPCDYPVKAMGANNQKFLQEMLFIAQKHCEDTTEGNVRTNKSKTGKYQSVTIVVRVESRSQLEELYQEMREHKDVKWML